MITIDTDYIQQMSMQLANYEVQGALARLERNEASYKAQLDAMGKLRSALTTFSSELRKLKSGGSSMLVNSARFSQEGYATATVSPKASAGRYQFFVEQLASAHQIALAGSQLQSQAEDGKTLTIALGTEDSKQFQLSITLDSGLYDENGELSLQRLAAAINDHADNKGIKAAVLRSGGDTYLLLTSEESGADNRIWIDGDAAAGVETRELSPAQDAIVHAGSGAERIELRSSSNRFDNIIDGVSITFSKVYAEGEVPLVVDIARDDDAIRNKVQSFVDAFNALKSSFDSLTASGGENSARGGLAGDSSIRAIENQLNALLRAEYGTEKNRLAAYGIVADRNGRLTIDSSRLEAAIAEDPAAFDQLFTGKDNLLDSIDKLVSRYTSSANGMLTNRMDSLNQGLRRLDREFEAIQRQYDNYYNRYLRQFTAMMQAMQAIQQTHGLFG